MKTVKIETGVMVMKEGKAWGKIYEDGRETNYGWMDAAYAEISNPEFCKKTSDVTYKGSHYIEELSTGKITNVKRITTIEIEIKSWI